MSYTHCCEIVRNHLPESNQFSVYPNRLWSEKRIMADSSAIDVRYSPDRSVRQKEVEHR
jgi:hypothetical protein